MSQNRKSLKEIKKSMIYKITYRKSIIQLNNANEIVIIREDNMKSKQALFKDRNMIYWKKMVT